MDEFNKAPIQAAELSREYGQQSLLSASEKAYHLWEMMGDVFGSVGGKERDDAIIDTESSDWRAE